MREKVRAIRQEMLSNSFFEGYVFLIAPINSVVLPIYLSELDPSFVRTCVCRAITGKKFPM